jgi:acyl-coenzyme A synthetase/AMP-(fatty) acid ligase
VAGAHAVHVDPDDAEDGDALRSSLERHHATALIGPAGAWRRLVAAEWAGPSGFTAVSTEPLSGDVVAALRERGADVHWAWGFEELGGWCGITRLEEAAAARVLGEPLPGVSVRVLEPTLEPAAAGVPGELWVGVAEGGPLEQQMPGSFRLDPHDGGGELRLLATGERVRRRHDGRIESLGRRDRRVSVRGARVELAEVEARLLEHPGVEEAAVVLRGDAPGDPRLVGYYVPAAGTASTDTEMRRHLRKALSPAAVPQHLVSMDSLPDRVNGSFDLRSLPAPFATGRKEPRAPTTDEERLLVEVWQEALGLSRVGVEDNFFDLGGHSLLAIEVVARLRERTGRSLKPRILLLSTLEQVAAELSRAEREGS